MALPELELSAVLTQLISSSTWNIAPTTTITYAFPTSTRGLTYDRQSSSELTGFSFVSASLQPIFTLAVRNWDDLIPQTFVETTSTNSNIEFAFSSSMPGYAHAYFPSAGSAWFKKGSAVSSASVGSYGFTTIMHELGHALGLNHMGDYDASRGPATPESTQDSTVLSIMSYFGPSRNAGFTEGVQWAEWEASGKTLSPDTPMVNDVLAIQSIYGISTTTRTEDTVYGFGVRNISAQAAQIFDFTINVDPVLTIFDSAGNDTINLSGWSTQSIISLVAGSYSSANGMTNNIAIAYSAVIENAIGGAGNDVLIGNASANRLEGGAGNDQLDGDAGDDTLIGGPGNDVIFGGVGIDTAVFSGLFATYTITFSSATAAFTVVGIATGTDTVSQVETFQFGDITRTAGQLQTGDSIAPMLISTSPADDATGLSPASNLIFTFSEAILAGTGNLLILNTSGSVARSIAITDTAQVTFAGRTVTVNPATDLTPGAGYFVNMASGVLTDLAGNKFAGIAGSSTYNFTIRAATDTTAPLLTSLNPADNATGVAPGSNLVLTFNEAMQAGTGNLLIFNANGTVARTIAVTDTTQLTISGSTVTINPSADLSSSSSYYLNLAAGVLKDLAGNPYAGIAGTTTYNFSIAAPVPTDDFPWATSTTGVVSVGGSAARGSIETAADRDLFKITLDAGKSYVFNLVRTSGGLTDPYLRLYNPNVDLILVDDDSAGDSNARITYAPTASGLYYLGASDYDTGTGDYTLSAALVDNTPPTLTGLTPADNASGVSPGANLVLSFSEAVRAGSGSISILSAGGSVVRSVAIADSSQVSLSGNTLTLNPITDLAYGTSYYLNLAPGALTDLAGNAFAGIAGTTAYNFTTIAPPITDDFPWTFSTSGQVAINGAASRGNIEIPNDADLFKVTLAAGVVYEFSLNRTSGGLPDPFLQFFSPSGEPLGVDDDSGGSLNSRFSFSSVTAGTYYLGASDNGKGVGGYSISAAIAADDYPSNASTSGRVTVNKPATTGVINSADDTDLLKIDLIADTTYVFSLTRSTGGLPDPFLLLFNPATELIYFDDDSGGTLNSQIRFTATSTGTFFLGATDYATGTGGYTLAATTAADDFPWSTATTGVVTVNRPGTTGVIDAVSDRDLFKVSLSAGTTYIFDLARTTNGLSDPYLKLFSPQMTLLAFDDDGAGSLNARLTYTATVTGTYFLGAEDADVDTGGYTLSATALAGSANFVNGTSGDDNLLGGAGIDIVSAGTGNDKLTGNGGNDSLDGGAGTDTAVFALARASYRIGKVGSHYVVTALAGNEGTDTLVSIEALQFADKTLPLANLARTAAPVYGKAESFLFDSVFYLISHTDLLAGVSQAGAAQNYLANGAAKGFTPNSWFDAGYYKTRWADLTPLNLDDATLFKHYNLFGVWEGRSGGPSFDRFDGNRYLADNPDVAAYVDANLPAFLGSRTNGAIAHFVIYGSNEDRSAYDTSAHLIDLGYSI